MALKFYKPTKEVKGSLIGIKFISKSDTFENGKATKGDKCFFFSLVRQTGWDEKTQNGTFKDGAKVNVKMSPTEISGIIRSITRNVELSPFFHDGGTQQTQIYFGPSFPKNKQVINGKETWVNDTSKPQKGFGLRVTKTDTANGNKESFTIGFTMDEAELLKQYLTYGLEHIFNALYREDVEEGKRNKAKYENQRGGAQPEQAAPEQEPAAVEAAPEDDDSF